MEHLAPDVCHWKRWNQGRIHFDPHKVPLKRLKKVPLERLKNCLSCKGTVCRPFVFNQENHNFLCKHRRVPYYFLLLIVLIIMTSIWPIQRYSLLTLFYFYFGSRLYYNLRAPGICIVTFTCLEFVS